MRDIGRRIAGWLVTRRALLDELVAVEHLAAERLIDLQASEAARRDLEEELTFWKGQRDHHDGRRGQQ